MTLAEPNGEIFDLNQFPLIHGIIRPAAAIFKRS